MEQPTTPAVSESKPALVIDTNAFIRCLDLQKLADKYEIYTSNNVLVEIRDKHARDKFAALGFDIKTYSADDKSYKFVEDFSKKTGDFASLSFTDKELIAIAYYLATQRGNEDKLRKQPPELTQWIPTENKEGFSDEESDEEEEEEKEEDDDGFVTVAPKKGVKNNHHNFHEKKQAPLQEAVVEAKQAEELGKEGIVLEKITEKGTTETAAAAQEADDDSSDEDDGQGWINPDNITKTLFKGTKKEDRIQEVGVTIMTADYAMQNVIIQIGLPLLSTEGYVIRQTRRFVLECYSCEKICKDPTKQFCPSCGNPTLKKLSVRANEDGTMTFYRNPRRRINNRGKIYSIPLSEGGRKNNDLLLREDEFLMRGRLQQLERQEKDKDRKFKQRLKDYENGLTFDDINLQHKYAGNKIQIGYGKVNPNDKNQFRKRK